MGCALYADGDAAAALDMFGTCLRDRVFRIGAMLFGIGSAGLFPVYVQSAADYVSLMALNASWSARRSADNAASARYLAMARASELWLKGYAGATSFEDSLKSLEGNTPL